MRLYHFWDGECRTEGPESDVWLQPLLGVSSAWDSVVSLKWALSLSISSTSSRVISINRMRKIGFFIDFGLIIFNLETYRRFKEFFQTKLGSGSFKLVCY